MSNSRMKCGVLFCLHIVHVGDEVGEGCSGAQGATLGSSHTVCCSPPCHHSTQKPAAAVLQGLQTNI